MDHRILRTCLPLAIEAFVISLPKLVIKIGYVNPRYLLIMIHLGINTFFKVPVWRVGCVGIGVGL